MKNNIKINEARVICEVAQTRSVSKAAANLSMAQPNISKYITGVESRIALQIFDRGGHELLLTRFGEMLLPHLQALLRQEDDISSIIGGYKREKTGLVTIYTSTGIIATLVNKFSQYLDDTDDICLAFKTIGLRASSIVDGIDFPDDCDILFTFFAPRDESLVALPIDTIRFNVFASPGYMQGKTIASPEDLEKYDCISLLTSAVKPQGLWTLTLPQGGTKTYKVPAKYICDNLATARELARLGKGIFYAPVESMSEDINNGTLVQLFDSHMSYASRLMIIFRKRSTLPYHVQFVLDKFIQFVRTLKVPE